MIRPRLRALFRKQPERNGVLIPYFLLSAAISVALCLLTRRRGLEAVGMFFLYWLAAFLGLGILLLLFLAVAALFVDPTKPQRTFHPFYNGLINYCLAVVWAIARVRIHVSGTERLPEGRFFLVCNHRSNFDPIVIGWVLRDRKLAFISKPENLRIPVVGRLLRKGCYLPIDRDNDREALKTVLTAIDLIKRDIVSIGLFPEGTRNRGSGLLPFRNGAFKIPQRAKCPVVICVLHGTEDIHRFSPWRDTDVALEFLDVIDGERAAQMTTQEMGEYARTCMTSALSDDS